MVVELGSFSPTPSGNTTLELNGSETPTFIEFWVGPRTGTTETTRDLASFGCVDITNEVVTWQSNYSDSTHFFTKNGVGDSTTPCLQHYESGSSKVIDIKFISATSGEFTVDVTTASSNYTVYFKVYG